MNVTELESSQKGLTGLVGYTSPISFIELVQKLGTPTNGDTDGKTHNEWVLDIDGCVVVLYDYKWDGSNPGKHTWHIGGHGAMAVVALERFLRIPCTTPRAF
tara:strand:+ start:277 stop:582 length:306 start_codon:yes stop_codon:yes gene_type:complete